MMLFVVVIFVITVNCNYFGYCNYIPQETCLTLGCFKAASTVLESIDQNVDPCDDFYEFACGNAIKQFKVPEDKQETGPFSILAENMLEKLHKALEDEKNEGESRAVILAKKYYRACMNEGLIENNGEKVITDLFKTMGGWPILGENSLENEDLEWSSLMKSFRKVGLDSNIFFKVTVEIDTKNSSKRSIELDQPAFGLVREYLTTGQYIDVYYKLMVNLATQLGANKFLAEKELKATLEFETELAKIALPSEERRNFTLLYNPTSIRELQLNYPKTRWLEYINAMLPLDSQVDENEVVNVVVPKFFASFEDLIERTAKRVQANFGFWRGLLAIINYAPNNLYKYYLNALHSVNGQVTRTARWKHCTEDTSNKLTYAVSSLYVRKYFDDETKIKAEEMVKYISKEFKKILKSIEWMDETTRTTALNKARKMAYYVGYPDEILNNEVLDEHYKDLKIDETEYLQSQLNLNIHSTDFAYRRLHEPVKKSDWTARKPTFDVGAIYSLSENLIDISAGILEGTFFDKDRPMYLNFGAIGSIIGHEITHGFDDQGRQLDENGNLFNWWPKDTEERFLKRVQCIIDQYSNYTVTELDDETVNGVITQGENIADNGGIEEAYYAYNTWVKEHEKELPLPGLNYEPRQLFWISAAMNWCYKSTTKTLRLKLATDLHSPERFRVIGPFSNSVEFSKDFKCSIDSKMNPPRKCKVW